MGTVAFDLCVTLIAVLLILIAAMSPTTATTVELPQTASDEAQQETLRSLRVVFHEHGSANPVDLQLDGASVAKVVTSDDVGAFKERLEEALRGVVRTRCTAEKRCILQLEGHRQATWEMGMAAYEAMKVVVGDPTYKQVEPQLEVVLQGE